ARRARLSALAPVVLLAGATGACSISFKLDSLMGKEAEPPTATLQPAAATAAGTPHEGDLALAKAAAAEALARGGNDVSVPWENPRTGARGTVTPIASAYTQDGFTCRDFLASYVHARNEAWLQGEACRIHQGRWEVRAVTPLH